MPDGDDHNLVHFPVVAVEHHIATVAKPDHQFLIFQGEPQNSEKIVR